MKIINLFLLILVIFFGFLSKNEGVENNKPIKKSTLPAESNKVQTDSSDCIDFHGVGAVCGKFKICPNHRLYPSELLRRKINSNLGNASEKVPPTCCRDYDTLSMKKKIFLLTMCWGGSYTEVWIYSLNKNGKFVSKEYGYNGIKLDTKTLGVHDFLLCEHHANEYALMGYNGNSFDTIKMVHCSEISNRNCW